MKWIKIFLKNLLAFLLVLLLLSQSVLLPADEYEQIRAYTRYEEFDYLSWMLDSLAAKMIRASLDAPRYMTLDEQRKLVLDYLDLERWIQQTTIKINQIYANPYQEAPAIAAADSLRELAILRGMEKSMKPLAESVLQYQVSSMIGKIGLGLGGQPIPPVLYKVTDLPNALIISPRDAIFQKYDISLLPDMTPAEMTALEDKVMANVNNVSALVVPVGGVGTYPSMIINTTYLPDLLDVIAHEWTHNYLTLRPLGLNYMTSPTLRTINETTANIVGKELGYAALQVYYPDIAAQVPPPAVPTIAEIIQQQQQAPQPSAPQPENPNAFDYYKEMHKTRVHVDELLAAGKVQEAEQYMEARRKDFWDHGFQIRRLNQAYFAFHGAYSDVPGGGAAGRDPVGPAVQMLRASSQSLPDFLYHISWMTSLEEIQQAVPLLSVSPPITRH